ncbi:MAG TPA: HAD family hydrolase [Candidatus Saccharimonadales bacterium]|nr:HAD family hydrolase [Candidatus Saccharimonadales bacterium]
MIKAISFDVGETIVDETREYGTWADWLDVPRHTFSAVFGAAVGRGGDYREAFQVFRPGFDLTAERQKRAEAGQAETFTEKDLYPDVRPALGSLAVMGVKTGLAGNQTEGAEAILRSLNLPVESIGTSASWGVEKPSIAFFKRIATAMGCDPAEILYVGDRLDNDIAPAQQAGMLTALIKRGPWGYILDSPASERCLFRIDSLLELPSLVEDYNSTVN